METMVTPALGARVPLQIDGGIVYVSPAFHAALRDRSLQRRMAFRVYLWLSERLDFAEFRPVKHLAIASDLVMGKQRVCDAITLLVDRGYLVAGEHVRSGPGGVQSYRLAHASPRTMPSVALPDHSPD